jgi:hypothetical protein
MYFIEAENDVFFFLRGLGSVVLCLGINLGVVNRSCIGRTIRLFSKACTGKR